MHKLARKTSALKWLARLTFIVFLDAVGVGSAATQGQPQGPPAFVTLQSSAQNEASNVQSVRTSGSPSGIRAGHILASELP